MSNRLFIGDYAVYISNKVFCMRNFSADTDPEVPYSCAFTGFTLDYYKMEALLPIFLLKLDERL